MANKFILTLLFCMCFWQSKAQESDTGRIEQTCMNYFEGFYEGNSTKIKSSIKPSLYKYGYWKKTNTEVYMGDGHMTFQQAIDCSNDVLKNKNFAKSNAPKKVNVQDISNHIAAAKITAWWSIDYVLLSRHNDGWLIEEVLWEDPLEKQSNVLSISYIGNMGVLLANNDNVVIIDGFHKKYKPEYAYPSESTVEKIINGEYQNFKKPDIALVTHHHKDHFDADYYRTFLQKNPESIVVASQQTIDLIHEGLNSDELEMSSALKQVLYNEEEYSGVHQNIEIIAFKCPHVNSARHSSVQNIAYLVSMGNYSILHLGDTNWDVAESILKKKKISDISLDVAILPYWMLLNKNSIEQVNSLLAPKRIIATHIPPDFSDTEYKNLQNKHSNITLFTELNEQIKYK
jgi:L-ascorbate metabolism protein UlaG (beta-lactamase superfamily)